MATLDPDDRQKEEDFIAYLLSLPTDTPAGATFRHARDLLYLRQAIDTLPVNVVRHIAKVLAVLNVRHEITAAAMCRQEFTE